MKRWAVHEPRRIDAFIRDRLIFVKIATAAIWLSWIASLAVSGFRHDIEGKPIGTDHIAFYSAAKLINDGKGDRIYDNRFMSQYQPKLHGSGDWGLDAYRNPPFYALLYSPTARLPYLTSFWIWTGVSAVMLWLGIGWLGTQKPLSVLLLSMSFYPVFAVFGFGQNSLLSFGVLCLTFHLMERQAVPGRNGFRTAALQTAIVIGSWPLVALELSPLSHVLAWPFDHRLDLACRQFARRPGGNERFRGEFHGDRALRRLHVLLAPQSACIRGPIAFDDKSVGNVVGLVCGLLSVALFIFFWSRRHNDLPVMFAAAVFLTLWASPHTMIYEWTLAIIPAVLLWDRVPEKRQEWLIMFSVAWIALFVSTPLAKVLFDWTKTRAADTAGRFRSASRFSDGLDCGPRACSWPRASTPPPKEATT